MKGLLWICVAAMAVSCNSADTKSTGKDSTGAASPTSAAVSPADMPYKIDNYREWEPGSSSNMVNAMNALKKWEEGKMDESVTYFADTIRVEFDGPGMTLSNDSLKHVFMSGWNEYKSVSIKMQDAESVISKDKKEEWVTLWYRQTTETKKGVKDSVDVINDIRMKNGKIVLLDEYTRKLH